MTDSSGSEQQVVVYERVCASTARSEYGLTETQLRTLQCTLTRNPHYRSAAPMRLYLRTELQALSDQLQYNREHKEEIREREQQHKREQSKKARTNALHVLSKSTKRTKIQLDTVGHESLLPEAMWRHTFGYLMPNDDLRGPDLVVCDLSSLRQSNRGMCAVAEIGISTLAERYTGLLTTEIDWDSVLENPMQFSLKQLKAAGKALKVKTTSCTKPLLCMQILQYFRLTTGVRFLPPSVLMALKQERESKTPWSCTALSMMFGNGFEYSERLYLFRRQMNEMQIVSTSQLLQLQQSADTLRKMQRGAGAAACVTCHNRSRALQCVRQQCGVCCDGDNCERHSR